MKKIRRIREIKSKIKVVRRLGDDGKEDEITQITASEALSKPTSFSPPVKSVQIGEGLGERVRRSSAVDTPVSGDGSRIEEREKERIQESKMYEGQGAMVQSRASGSSGSRESYTQVESIQTNRMKEVKMAGNFGMQRRQSLMAEDQMVSQTQTKIREGSMSEEKYGPGKIEGERKKKERKMPWEI